MIFPKKLIKLKSSEYLNTNEIMKTEAFSSNGRKYRMSKGLELVIEREYQDYFDRAGFEQLKFCITAKGSFNPIDDEIITSLTTQLQNGINNLFTISGLILLIVTLCLDANFGTYSTVVIIMFYGFIYLLLTNALINFNDDLSSDIKYYNQTDNN